MESVTEGGDVFGFEFEFAVFEDCGADILYGEVELELVDGFRIDFDGDEALRMLPVDIDVGGNLEAISAYSMLCSQSRDLSHIFQECLFDSAFNDSRSTNVVLVMELTANNRSCDFFGCIDDLLDTGNPLCDAHTSNASKMESL